MEIDLHKKVEVSIELNVKKVHLWFSGLDKENRKEVLELWFSEEYDFPPNPKLVYNQDDFPIYCFWADVEITEEPKLPVFFDASKFKHLEFWSAEIDSFIEERFNKLRQKENFEMLLKKFGNFDITEN